VSLLRGGWTLPLLVFVAACTDQPTVPRGTEPPPPEPPVANVVGVYEFTLTGIGGPAPAPGASLAPTAPPVRALGVAPGGLSYELLSSTSSVEGARGRGGHRYISFTYRVRNGTGATLTNLTLVPVTMGTSHPGTPFVGIKLLSGGDADPLLAPRIVPTGAAVMGGDGQLQSPYADVLQVFDEAEVAAIDPPDEVTAIFPYGFVVRNPSTPASRALPVAADENDFAGVVTFAFRIPLHEDGYAADPFSLTFTALAVEDTETRLTESLEESRDTAAVRRARAAAAALGVTQVTVLAGSPAAAPDVTDYPGQRQLCAVRTAGPAGAPETLITAPAAYTGIQVLNPGETMDPCAAYFRGGTSARPATNVSYPLTVYAVDRYGNVDAAAADTVALEAAPGPPVTIGPSAELVNGTGTVEVTYLGYGNSLLQAVGRRNQGERSILVAGVTRVWTAGAGTSDWFTGGNWQWGAAPMDQDSVLIPASVSPGPELTGNALVSGVTVEDLATLSLGAFNLTAGANVHTGVNGGITSTSGRLLLVGTDMTIIGILPRTEVRGRYSLSGNVSARAPLRIAGGRLRDVSFRLRAISY